MLRTLIALDGSSVSTQMIDMAREVLAGKCAQVTLLHVTPLAQLQSHGGADPLIVIEGFETDDDRMDLAPLDLSSRRPVSLHLVPRHLVRDSDASPLLSSDECDQERRISLDLLARYAQMLQRGNRNLQIRCDSAIGDPADLILTTADHLKATLLIVGGRQSTLPSRYPLGSVSYRVSLHARCPVLIVHPRDMMEGQVPHRIAQSTLA